MLIEQWCHVGTAPCCNFFSDKKLTHPPRVLIKINYPANPNTAWRLRIYRGVIANSIVLYSGGSSKAWRALRPPCVAVETRELQTAFKASILASYTSTDQSTFH